MLAACVIVPVPVTGGLGVSPRPVDLSSPPHACPVSAETDAIAAPGLAALNAARAEAGQ